MPETLLPARDLENELANLAAAAAAFLGAAEANGVTLTITAFGVPVTFNLATGK